MNDSTDVLHVYAANPLPPLTRAELADASGALGKGMRHVQRLLEQAALPVALAEAIAGYMPALKALCEVLTDAVDADRLRPWDIADQDSARLLALDAGLRDMASLITLVKPSLEKGLRAKLEDPADPLWDYEVDAEARYLLSEDDADFDAEGDNIVLHRDYSSSELELALEGEDFNHRRAWLASGDPAADRARGQPNWLRAPHNYLMHDLYDHAYGPGSPSLHPKTIARLGKVWVDVVVRHQYLLDLKVATDASLRHQMSRQP